MKRTFLLLLLFSHANCPMFSMVATLLQKAHNLAVTFEDYLYTYDNSEDNEINSDRFLHAGIDNKSLALHFEKIKLKQQASLLARKNNELTRIYYFQKLKKHAENKKQEERYKQIISLLTKAQISMQKNAELRATIEERITKKQNLLDAKKQNIIASKDLGFDYISQSDLSTM